MSRIFSAALSVVIGLVLAHALIWCWAYISAMSPLPSLLVHNGFSGTALWAVIASTDFLINVLLCFPAAWAIRQLGAVHIRINTLLAVVSFAAAGALAIGLPLFSYGTKVIVPYTLLLASLPTAVWLLSKLSRNAPNNSFKPTPLRGAA